MELKIIDGLFETRAVNSERRSVDAVMSTDTIDRYFERIKHNAWEKRLSRFLSSPVLLKDHDHTKPIGHWENVRITKESLVGTAIFASTPDAEERFVLHRDGHVKAFSVGFIPHKWSYRDEQVEDKPMRIKLYEDCELLECSSVACPANTDALQRLMRTFSADGRAASDNDLDARMEAAAERAINKRFSTDPGGLMTTFAQDVAELVAASVGRGADPYGDIPDQDDMPDPDPEPKGEPSHQLNAALRDVLGK